eukprot:Clim_evm41s99 gene=Clim_evmTU41s99
MSNAVAFVRDSVREAQNFVSNVYYHYVAPSVVALASASLSLTHRSRGDMHGALMVYEVRPPLSSALLLMTVTVIPYYALKNLKRGLGKWYRRRGLRDEDKVYLQREYMHVVSDTGKLTNGEYMARIFTLVRLTLRPLIKDLKKSQKIPKKSAKKPNPHELQGYIQLMLDHTALFAAKLNANSSELRTMAQFLMEKRMAFKDLVQAGFAVPFTAKDVGTAFSYGLQLVNWATEAEYVFEMDHRMEMLANYRQCLLVLQQSHVQHTEQMSHLRPDTLVMGWSPPRGQPSSGQSPMNTSRLSSYAAQPADESLRGSQLNMDARSFTREDDRAGTTVVGNDSTSSQRASMNNLQQDMSPVPAAGPRKPRYTSTSSNPSMARSGGLHNSVDMSSMARGDAMSFSEISESGTAGGTGNINGNGNGLQQRSYTDRNYPSSNMTNDSLDGGFFTESASQRSNSLRRVNSRQRYSGQSGTLVYRNPSTTSHGSNIQHSKSYRLHRYDSTAKTPSQRRSEVDLSGFDDHVESREYIATNADTDEDERSM